MTSKKISKEVKDKTEKLMDFEEFYNEMIKNDPLFFKDYYLKILYPEDYYKDHSKCLIEMIGLKDCYYKEQFSCKIDLTDTEEKKKYFRKLNFFPTLRWMYGCANILNIESIKDILNNKKSSYAFSDIENNMITFINNEKYNKSTLLMCFSIKKFESYLTDNEKEKLNMQLKTLEIKKRERITEQHKDNYEESKRKLEEMKSDLTEEEKLLLTLRGII